MHLTRFVEEKLAEMVPDLTVLELVSVLNELTLRYTQDLAKASEVKKKGLLSFCLLGLNIFRQRV